MTWTKLSDDFTDETETLSNEAFRLHVEGLTFSNRKLLDCLLTPQQVQRLNCSESVGELLDGGYWEQRGDMFEIVHHARYQPTKEDVLKRQRANRENGKKGGRPKAERERFQHQSRHRETHSVSNSVSHSLTQNETPSLTHSQNKTHSQSRSLTQTDGTGIREEVKQNHSADTGVHVSTDGSSWSAIQPPTGEPPRGVCNDCWSESAGEVLNSDLIPGKSWCSQHEAKFGGEGFAA